ncbi:uncharacterized protein TNCV_3949231 [Trichonephila clavipes]|nr:uncharacterized protein TNCV_3949231 [Trichonephila clavipes]
MWILHQVNASVYNALSLKQFLVDKCIILIERPPYSRDLALFDFYLFLGVNNVLMGTHFQSVGKVKAKTANLLKMVAPNESQHCFERWKTSTQSGRGSQVAKVSDHDWPCHEFEPSTTKESPCRGVIHVKFVESSNVLPLVW